MNQYICQDFLDLKKSNKYIWSYYQSNSTNEYPLIFVAEALFATTRKGLIEQIRVYFIKGNLDDSDKDELSELEFKSIVKSFKEMMDFFESNESELTYYFEPYDHYYNIKKIYVNEFENEM